MDNPLFFPNRGRAQENVSRMRERLIKSVLHIAERTPSTIESSHLQAIRERLAQARNCVYVTPSLFALYHAILLELRRKHSSRSEKLLRAIAEGNWGRARREIVDFDAVAFDPLIFELYKEALDVDPSTKVCVTAPTSETSRVARRRIRESLALLQQCLPEFADEIDLVLAQIVLVSETNDQKRPTFAGGSSFHLWGAIFINTRSFESSFDLLLGIVHEVAHLLLFAEALDEPLVLNDPKEVFPSPLRRELRPMDGIYHAVFVTARMHLAARNLSNDEYEAGKWSNQLHAKISIFERLFWDGFRTIEKHGALTETGRALMAAAGGYMRAEAMHTAHLR